LTQRFRVRGEIGFQLAPRVRGVEAEDFLPHETDGRPAIRCERHSGRIVQGQNDSFLKVRGESQNFRRSVFTVHGGQLQQLPDYPTFETPQGKIFVDVVGAPPIEYNIPAPLVPVFPAEDPSFWTKRPGGRKMDKRCVVVH
jgi:hypothetical protein